jgi:hypothetical protein
VPAIVDMPEGLISVLGASGRFKDLHLEKLSALVMDPDIVGLADNASVSVRGEALSVDRILADGTGVSVIQFKSEISGGQSSWQS